MSDKLSYVFRYLLPPYACFLLIGHMVLMMIRPEYPLGDPGTPWHFKWGQLLLEQMSLPTQDFFSHTMPGREWINYQWLFHVLVGITQRVGGIAFTTAVLMSVYAFLPVLMFRRMLRAGCHVALAMAMAGLGWFILTMHSLDRPHIFTYLFFSIFLERLYAMYEGETDLKGSWWLIPLMVLWTNLHAGFSAGLLLIGAVFLTAFGRYLWDRSSENRLAMQSVFLTGLFCGLASLINPYGIQLHLHVLDFLNLKVLARWEEFASSDFYNPSGNVRGFEFLLVLLLVVLFNNGRQKDKFLSVLDLVLCVIFLHFALKSGRHIILFTLVAVPVVARGLDELLRSRKRFWLVRRGYELTEQQLEMRGGMIYMPLLVLAYLGLSLFPSSLFKNNFYDIHLSRGTADYVRGHRDQFKHMFNSDSMGGALIYYFGPEIKVFADDRADFYWQDFMAEKFFKVRFGQKGWDQVLDEYHVDSLILPKENALEALLVNAPQWVKVHEDDLNVVYLREGAVGLDEARQPSTVP